MKVRTNICKHPQLAAAVEKANKLSGQTMQLIEGPAPLDASKPEYVQQPYGFDHLVSGDEKVTNWWNEFEKIREHNDLTGEDVYKL